MKLRILPCLLGMLFCLSPASADTAEEYRLKLAFLYNFVSFTEWPATVGATLNLCVYGQDSFGDDLYKLQGRSVAGRSLTVRRATSVDTLANCQVVFIAQPVINNLPRVLDSLRGKPVLTVADSPGASSQGVMLNMSTAQNRIQFEANLAGARDNGLVLSSKLLRLAKEVHQ
jgi:hypothetical protein